MRWESHDVLESDFFLVGTVFNILDLHGTNYIVKKPLKYIRLLKI